MVVKDITLVYGALFTWAMLQTDRHFLVLILFSNNLRVDGCVCMSYTSKQTLTRGVSLSLSLSLYVCACVCVRTHVGDIGETFGTSWRLYMYMDYSLRYSALQFDMGEEYTSLVPRLQWAVWNKRRSGY